MSIGFPESSKEVEDRIKVDVAREAPDSNPYIQNSWLLALVTGFGRRVFDFYRDLKRSEDNTFPDTAVGERAEQWGTIYGKTRIPGTQASGLCAATGTALTLVPVGTPLDSNGVVYTTTDDATISDQAISVFGISRSGDIATVLTVSEHLLASNIPVTISGAVQTEYNVTDAEITIIGTNLFTYTVLGSPAPATGTILAAFTSASVPVISDASGLIMNLTSDTPLTLQSPIAGIDDVFNVGFDGITGGTDQETDDELKSRYLELIQNPVAHFSVSDIENKAKEIVGVTRVFVHDAGTTFGTVNITSINRTVQVATVVTTAPHDLENHMQVTISGATQTEYNVVDAPILVIDSTTFVYIVTGSPTSPATGGPVATGKIALGAVQIYFTRDDDDSSIPSATEVNEVSNKLLEILPANTAEFNMIVLAPTALPVDFTFTTLVPNTITMRSAIEANLEQFFKEVPSVSEDIDEDAYRATIKNTVDTLTGDTVEDFVLSTPTGDVTVDFGELGVLGTLTI